jgi:group II intron reverse transcriptase/maturase
METKLRLIKEIAEKDRKQKFNNLIHLLNETGLRECFYLLKKDKATGIDGVTFTEYEQNLEANLSDLVARMKQFSYRPQAVRRVYIPKANGKLRPLGIPALEDKIVQMGIARILTAIYEADFADFSYGFRPGRNCHQALDRLDKIIMQQPINYIIDADIKGFFDNVDHRWLRRCLEERISDPNLLRYIVRFLKAGVMEEGKWRETEKGTPQGGIISPILANIYLHYALDLWFGKVIRRQSRGIVAMVRYADDFIICVQYQDEANWILTELRKRLAQFGLELAADKTKIIGFGRYAKDNARKQGQTRRGGRTFNFLGFTHYCDKTRTGKFKVGRTTDRKKLTTKLKAMNDWLKAIRNTATVKGWWKTVGAKLRGHFQYYGVSGNFRAIQRFYYLTIRMVYKWLNRRSQKRSFNWISFNKYLTRYPLPKPKIYHNFYTLYSY